MVTSNDLILHALQKKGGLKIRENIPFHESNKSRNNEVV